MRPAFRLCSLFVVGVLLGTAAPCRAERETAEPPLQDVVGDFFAGLRKAFELYPAAPGMPPGLVPPQCDIACEGKDVKVLILAEHVTLPTNPLLRQTDYELSYRLTQLLRECYEENKERVEIVSPNELREYKNTHPKWREQTAQEIGKHFHADYVISLEINEIRLYDKRNAEFFYHGYADIDVTVTDVSKPIGEGEKFHCPYALEYPRAPLERTDMSVSQFRAKLLDRVCKDLVQFFAAHPPKDRYDE